MAQRKIQPDQLDASIVTHTELVDYVENNSAASPSSFKRNQVVSGTVNGTNVDFTVPDTYETSTLAVYLNGQRLTPGASNDYTETAGGFTMAYAPATGDVLTADYLIAEVAITTTTSFVTGETPSGTINGTNLNFTVATPYAANSLEVFLDGVRQTKTSDYTETPLTGAFNFVAGNAPASGSVMRVNYSTAAAHLISGSNSIVTGEVPTGTKNGTNPTFTVLSPSYVGNSLEVKLNGIDLQRGVDFLETTPASGIFTLQAGYIPTSTDVLTVSYQANATTTGNADTVDSYHVAATPTANTLVPLDASGNLPVAANTAGVVRQLGMVMRNDTEKQVSMVADIYVDIMNQADTQPMYLNITSTQSKFYVDVTLVAWTNADGYKRVRLAVDSGISDVTPTYWSQGYVINSVVPATMTFEVNKPAGAHTVNAQIVRVGSSGNLSYRGCVIKAYEVIE